MKFEDYLKEIGARKNAQGGYTLKIELIGIVNPSDVNPYGFIKVIRGMRERFLLDCDDKIGWAFDCEMEGNSTLLVANKDQGGE